MNVIEKGWGSEEIWASNEKYCGKFLNFNSGSRFSMHFHHLKDETWYVISGKFLLLIIDTADGSMNEILLEQGNIWRNEPLVPHQLVCIEKGTIIEVSTADSIEDNYRVFPGDSQR